MDVVARLAINLMAIACFLLIVWYVRRCHRSANTGFLIFAWFYRLPYLFIYYYFIPGDWQIYYNEAVRADSLESIFGFGVDGVVTLAYPLSQLGCSILDIFFVFSTFGYFGFVLFYLIGHKLTQGTDKVLIGRFNIFPWILLYPSLHMYTVMLGKDPVVLLGLGLLGYSLTFFRFRWDYIAIGTFLLMLVRPHIMYVVIFSLVVAIILSNEWSFEKKTLLTITSLVVGVSLLPVVLANFRIDEFTLESIRYAIDLNEGYMSHATTYIDMTAYPLLAKAFTYLYRPLFFDSPTIMLLEYSAENLIFLLLSLTLVKLSFPGWFSRQPLIIKFSMVFFIIGTLILCNGLSVYGLFIRQKTMVMMFFLLVIFAFVHDRGVRRGIRSYRMN